MIPLRATNVKLTQHWPAYIIIHHTACKISNAGEVMIDTPKFQAHSYMLINFQRNKAETGFHFIIDRVKNDFQVVVSQPLMTQCIYPDLDEQYYSAVHIALLGNYDEDIPMKRLYKVLAYRLLVPLMRLFYIKESEILLHSAITNDNSVTCPGEFINKAEIVTEIRNFMRKKSIARTKRRAGK